MTPEERKELERIRRARGRHSNESERTEPTYKDLKKTSVWHLKLFGRLLEIRVSNPA
jgi:hypothetical protein